MQCKLFFQLIDYFNACFCNFIYFVSFFVRVSRTIPDQCKNLEMLKSTKKKAKITCDHMIHSTDNKF